MKSVGDDVNQDKNDDLLVLSHLFSLPKLHYIDIASQQKTPLILQRWPLLAELALIDMPKSAEEV
ncbi:cellulose biosynthesis protein BcsR [Ewingella sp. S1.OA.A_B6]